MRPRHSHRFALFKLPSTAPRMVLTPSLTAAKLKRKANKLDPMGISAAMAAAVERPSHHTGCLVCSSLPWLQQSRCRPSPAGASSQVARLCSHMIHTTQRLGIPKSLKKAWKIKMMSSQGQKNRSNANICIKISKQCQARTRQLEGHQ